MILGQLPNPKTMKTSYINPQQKLPFLVEPIDQKHSKEDLLQWMKANAELVKKHFYEDGALLFRGFDIDTPKDFEDLALQVDPGLKNDYYGTSPRNIVKNTTYIYTASELPGYYPIMQHCEMSYVPQPPISLFFFCHIEPEYGGETPVCNFRKVYAELDQKIKAEFDQKGVLTVRNYSGLDSKGFNLFELKKWNEIFLTTDKAEVERQCKAQNIEFEWRANGNLRLVHRTPASIANPVTGERAWFNHLQVFHPDAAAIEYDYIHAKQGRGKTFLWKWFLKVMVAFKNATTAPMDQSMNVLFGDGTPIPHSYVKHVQEVIWKNMVIFPWRKNDVLAIDNFSTSHGRLPYEGPREILVCWSA
jgi:alpha-ketoglutarate-dependent taurine dioxygenase